MINIDKFKDFIYLVANKSGRGTLTPAQFNTATERGLYAWTNNQVANQKQFQPGSPISQTSFEMDAIATEKLRHLKENRDVRVISGKMFLPDGTNTDVNGEIMPGMWFPSRISHKYTFKGNIKNPAIEIVKDSEWNLRLGSYIVEPSTGYPIGNYQSNYLLIAPSSIIITNFVYVRNPTKPVWGYTTTNSRPLYDAATSVDLDAPESAMNEIAMIVLEFIGIRIREQELVQAAAGLENKGV